MVFIKPAIELFKISDPSGFPLSNIFFLFSLSNEIWECKPLPALSPKGFDKFGNYTFGIKEHIVFPEVNFDKVDKIRGLDITIVIKSKNKKHSYELLKELNFPFVEKRSN